MPVRYGMVIDIDRCIGCGSCMAACSVENNLPGPPPDSGLEKELAWIRVYRLDPPPGTNDRPVYLPVPCQHCEHDTPCISVCLQAATELDPQTGIVNPIPSRCLGCRYCMAACPYHARYLNWFDPVWPKGPQRQPAPDVSLRRRTVVEKCNFCQARWQAAREAAAHRAGSSEDRASGPQLGIECQPACAEACPTEAICFGDLNDPACRAARLRSQPRAFRLMEGLGTEPKVYYLSRRAWVRAATRLAQGSALITSITGWASFMT